MGRRPRPRRQFKFWLYHDIEVDSRLMEYIDYLRATRQFATTIRNGLRLMWTLSEGDLTVLFELFPTLRLKLTEPSPPTTPGGDFQKMLTEAAKQGAQLALLEVPALPPPTPNDPGLLNKSALPAATGAPGMVGTGMGQIKTSFQVQAPTFDDEDTVVIRKDTSAGEEAINNFFASVQGTQNTPGSTSRHTRSDVQ